MIYSFITSGETPSKKNSRVVNTKTGRSFPNKKYVEWHRGAVSELNRQERPPRPIDFPVLVVMRFTHGDERRRDSDNGASSILDTLKDAGIIADDNWEIIRAISILNEYEKNGAKCEITLQDFPGAKE